MKGDNNEKVLNFSFLGIPKYMRRRTSDHTLYIEKQRNVLSFALLWSGEIKKANLSQVCYRQVKYCWR